LQIFLAFLQNSNTPITLPMTKVGINIKKIRTTKGLSQQAFADIFDLSRGNISSYEEGRAEPKLDSLSRIANYFSIPLSDFIAKNLTVNEILKFNGDKLIEEEQHIIQLQLREVPFISDSIYMKCCHAEIKFNEFTAFPKLVLPETSNSNLLALTFNNNIPHHQELAHYQMHDVLVFEELTEQNVHLCNGKNGLYISETEIVIGKFEIKGKKVTLALSDFKNYNYLFDTSKQFWKLFAVYGHEV